MKIGIEKYEIMRGEDEWQRAGAYSVRIQGMNRQHSISLRDEFDEKDCEGTRYIVILDQGYPVATCRFYKSSEDCVTLGRLVVLPEYRGKSLGKLAVSEAEKWIKDLGFSKVFIESRVNAVGFYDKIGYRKIDETIVTSGVFQCIRMIKKL